MNYLHLGEYSYAKLVAKGGALMLSVSEQEEAVFRNESDFHYWLSSYDPKDVAPDRLTERFISGVNLLGIDVYRSSMWLPTAHPELWGTQVVWARNKKTQIFRRDHDITSTPIYLNTPGEAVHNTREAMRWKLNVAPDKLPYPMLRDIQNEGGTDYLIVPFHTDHAQEQPWVTFSTKREGGFSVLDIKTLKELCVPLSWKARVHIAEAATHSLLSVYLGKNAAQRVMKGQFRRGTGQAINAVIWFCDLRDFTKLGDHCSASELVNILDQYFECVASPVEDCGGEVLKFIGDAVLAIFPLNKAPEVVCRHAFKAAKIALKNLEIWSSKKHGRPTLKAGIALHIGEVLYGNIGGRSRLDFTVIGSAVNEASRIESLCKTISPLLATREFAQYLEKGEMISIGHQALRGVSNEIEVFALSE